mgnify:CR=1 FL=1
MVLKDSERVTEDWAFFSGLWSPSWPKERLLRFARNDRMQVGVVVRDGGRGILLRSSVIVMTNIQKGKNFPER